MYIVSIDFRLYHRIEEATMRAPCYETRKAADGTISTFCDGEAIANHDTEYQADEYLASIGVEAYREYREADDVDFWTRYTAPITVCVD